MANYDVNKLTKLGALKQLAERIAEDFATQEELSSLQSEVTSLGSDVDTLEGKVDKLEAASGEANVIEKIKVNGEEQDIGADKSVDIEVPEKVSDLENDEGFQKANEVKSAIDAAIDQFTKDVTANDTVDTFKELVDYVAKHAPEAAKFAADILEAQGDIEALETLVGSKSVAEQIATALGNYVEKEAGKKLSTEDFTTEEKNKLKDIDPNANNYTHPDSEAGAKDSNLYKIATDKFGHVTGAVVVTATDIEGLGVEITDTTYNDVVAGGTSGLMSGADKTKLDGIDYATTEEITAMLNEVFAAE